jgi:transposase InsO family protein
MEGKGKSQRSKEEKLMFLKAAEEHGRTEACQRFGIAHTTYYYWKKKLEEGGEEALAGRSGGTNRAQREIEGWKRKEVLAEKEENPGYGPSQIRNQLRRRGMTISTLTIRQVLEEAGYQIKRIKEKKEWQRFEAGRPLELVQIDIAEFYIHKQRVYLVLLLDDYSRFLLGFRLIEQCNMEEIQGLLDEAISRYGKMERILSDRGFVFHGWRGINRFERHLDELDIYHIHTSPHHPETIGKLEAVNKAIQKELLRQVEFKNIAEARERIEVWIWRYNYKRVHQGLGGVMVPAERFHGWVKEIDRELSRVVEEGITLEGREISLLHVKMCDSLVEMTIMGKKLKLA